MCLSALHQSTASVVLNFLANIGTIKILNLSLVLFCIVPVFKQIEIELYVVLVPRAKKKKLY